MSADRKEIAAGLRRDIEALSRRIDRTVRIMEVCGTHTVALRQHGIHSMLPDAVRLISGPGCPVCVTPSGYIDNAFELIERHGCTILSFGDMVKVPGSDGRTLSQYLGTGQVRIVYSPAEMTQLEETDKPAVFLGIGFETTIPVVLAGFDRARSGARSGERSGLRNGARSGPRNGAPDLARGDVSGSAKDVYLYTAFKTVPPALEFLLSDPGHRIDGFLLPGHVSVIIGADGYSFLENRIAGAITGFEPLDMLVGIRALLANIAGGEKAVSNEYKRAVTAGGNAKARAIMETYLVPYDASWRAIGSIPGSGLRLKEEYGDLDAAGKFGLGEEQDIHAPGCLCGSVIQGKSIPTDCGLFGRTCTPDRPVGPCMVSSEGTCAAYLRYGG